MFGLTTPIAPWLEAVLMLILVSSLMMLAAERQIQNIRMVAFQGLLLGAMPLLIGLLGLSDITSDTLFSWHIVVTSALFLVIKAFALPYILKRTHNDLPPQAPLAPYIGHKLCIFLGLVGFALSLWLVRRLAIPANPLFSAFFPPAMATMFAGLLMIVSRRTALSQVIGYLVLENGIYLLGVPLTGHDALWVELSTLLDLCVAVFVMGIAIYRINSAFDSTDTDRLALLRD